MPADIALLQRLCETPGIAGREERVRALVEKEISGLFDEVRTDAMGSLICTRRSRGGGGPRALVAAHMDEIGFYVRHVDEKGFVWINPAGGFDTRNLFSRRVLVCTEDGDFKGVMNPGGKPVHIATEEEKKKVPTIEEFFIDLGMPADEVRAKVRVGDFVVMDEPFLRQPKKAVSKALDNRVACFVAIEAVRALAQSDAKHDKEIVVAFTVQEEVGLRGATTVANAVNADLGIGLDVTLSVDTPGVPENMAVAIHGKGAAVMFQDSSMIADAQLTRDLCRLAEAKGIPHQRCILGRGGQDGAAIQRANDGARCTTITVGTRYIHTVTEQIDLGDLQAAVDLLSAWLAS